MNSVLSFILETSFVFASLYSVYFLVLKRLTFHGLNRFVLLAFVPVSLIVPLINFDIFPVVSNEIHIPKFDEMFYLSQQNTIDSIGIQNQFSFNFSLNFLYVTGVVVYGIFLMLSVLKLFKIKNHSIKIYQEKYLVITGQISSTFSFFNWIFLPEEIYNKNEKPIIEHEKIHHDYRHTIDLIITEVFIAFFWFNPFVYFFRKSIKSIHEYQVDSQILNKGVKKSHYLQLMLNNITSGRNRLGLYNYFDYLSIKKRVNMITKAKSHKFQLVRYMFILPVIVILAMSFSIKENNNPDIYPINKDKLVSVAQLFGVEFKNPITQKVMIHGGVDLEAEEGIAVYSTADGEVVSATNNGGWGNLIVVDHGNGFETWYAHLKDFAVEKGDKVTKGQEIGFVGNTGNSTGPHLHYEIRLNNKRVDPFDYIKK